VSMRDEKRFAGDWKAIKSRVGNMGRKVINSHKAIKKGSMEKDQWGSIKIRRLEGSDQK